MNAGTRQATTSMPGDLTMRVLYLKGTRPDADRGVLQQLLAVAPRLELMTIAAPAEALVEVRRMLGWQVLLISPSAPTEDTLALIGSLRRDRVPIAVVPVVDEANHHLLADAVTAGADAVLLLRDHTLIRVAETLARLNHNPRVQPPRFQQRLRVLYIGADPTVWNLLDELSFVEPIRLDPDRDPVMNRLSAGAEDPLQYDVAVIDDEHGDPLPSEVLTAVKSQSPDASTIVLSSPAAFAAAPRSMAPGADVTFSKTGSFQQPLADTLQRLHDSLEVARREAESRAREERLREIVDLVPAAILVLATSGPVLAMNTEGLRLFGATGARQVVGRDIRSFLGEADREAMTEWLRSAGRGEASPVSIPVATVDARTVEMEFRATLLGGDAAPHRGIVVAASLVRQATQSSSPAPPPDETETQHIAQLQRRCDELTALLAHEELARITDRAAHEEERQTLEAAHRAEKVSLQATAEERATSDRTEWQAERDEAQRAVAELRSRAAGAESLQIALDSLRNELRETDGDHARERATWTARISELEQQLMDEQERSVESVTAERLARDVVRDEADTLRTLLEQELKKRSDAERRQALLQDAYTHASGDRDRLIAANLFGFAVMTQHGEVVRCNDAFARLFGYADGPELLSVTAGRPFPMLAGRLALDARLKLEGRLTRVESTLDRLDGQPVQVIESAALLSDTLDGAALIERIFVENTAGTTLDRIRVERLAEVGSLAVTMTPAIEAIATALVQRARGSVVGVTDEQDESLAGLAGEVQALVRQLGAFGRRQTVAIENLNLDEVIRHSQPVLARLIGEFVDFELRLGANVRVLAGRHDLDELLVALATLARASLPVGGRVVLETGDRRPATPAETSDAALWMTMTGYGVGPPAEIAAVSQAAQRCQASVQLHTNTPGGVRVDVLFAKTS